MKKSNLIVLAIIFSVSCSKGELSKKDFPNYIIGKWKAVSLGKKFTEIGVKLPAGFSFKKDGTYSQTFIENNEKRTLKGKYKIFYNKFIARLILYQKVPRRIKITGLVDFVTPNTMKVVLSNPYVVKHPVRFSSDFLQNYLRIKEEN